MQSKTMKTKLIAVVATVMASFGCGIAWGQFVPNNRNTEPSLRQLQPNQPTVSFNDGQGVLTNIERVGTAPYYKYIVHGYAAIRGAGMKTRTIFRSYLNANIAVPSRKPTSVTTEDARN